MSLEVVPIHDHPEYLNDCCKIINREWKRSDTARLHSLKQSKDNLPTSLILLKDKAIIGHVKLSEIHSIRAACFIETVVIEKNHRGKGYGSILMKEAEKFCMGLGLKTIYLSTKGQEEFYVKLGYIECAPVSIYGGIVDKISNLIFKKTNEEKLKEKKVQISENLPPPPPPPPLPPSIPDNFKSHKNKKIYMKKDL